MSKILTPLMVAALAFGRPFRDDDAGADGAGKTESTGRLIKMDDGREINFGEKTKMKKSYGMEGTNVFCLIDFDNGKSVKLLVDPASEVGLQACGHGLSQKLGDAAAGADTTEDAFEAVLEVATRVNKGEWAKTREGGGGTAKGASELVIALAEYMGKEKDAIRELLSGLNAGEKAALRKVPAIATIIERLKSEKEPSKKEKEKIDAAAAMLEGLKEGRLPERTEGNAEGDEPSGEANGEQPTDEQPVRRRGKKGE